MKKALIAVIAALALAAAAMGTPAEARNGRIAAGVAAGLIGGAIVGGAIASQNPYYGYGPGYYYAPAPRSYYGPTYVADPYDYPPPACYWQRQQFWDGYGWRVRRVRVCG